jgi:antitoxin (DNA-binding transcriptional repressor) of toxin-antitoxin stability system
MGTESSIQSKALRDDMRRVLDEVQHDGEHVTILRYSQPAGVIVPPGWHERAEALMAKYGETEG